MEYVLRGISEAEVQSEVDKFFTLLRADKNAQNEVTAAGLDLAAVEDAVRQAGDEKPIQVNPTGASLDPITTAVAIAAVKLGATVLTDLWTHVLLPRVRRRFGPDSIRPVEPKG